MDTLKYFINDGIYKLTGSERDFIFLCIVENPVSKLVQYKNEDGIYVKTDVSYFLTSYREDDIKSIFVNRDNYEMIGILGQNFVISDNKEKIIG